MCKNINKKYIFTYGAWPQYRRIPRLVGKIWTLMQLISPPGLSGDKIQWTKLIYLPQNDQNSVQWIMDMLAHIENVDVCMETLVSV